MSDAPTDIAALVKDIQTRLTTSEKRLVLLQAAVEGLPHSPGPVSPVQSRTMKFPNAAKTRVIMKAPLREVPANILFARQNYDDIENTSAATGNLVTYPEALDVQTYALMASCEVDTGAVFTAGAWSTAHDDGNTSGAYKAFADAYADAHSLSREALWLHVRSGDQNFACNISSISLTGAVVFTNPMFAGQYTSFPFSVGQTVTLSNLTAGNGTYVIASLQKNGVTLVGWVSGALGTLAPILTGTSRIGVLYVPGTGIANVSNRKWLFYFSEWRNLPYHGNTGCQDMMVSRFQKIMLNSASGGQPINSALIDEMDSAMYTNPNPQSMEYGTTGGTTFGSPVGCPWSADAAVTLGKIRAGMGFEIFLRVNTASRGFFNDARIGDAAGGVHGEQLLNIFGTDTAFLDFGKARVQAGTDLEFVDGNTWLSAANNGGVIPNPGVFGTSGSYNAGNFGNASQRRQMASYALYLMIMDATYTAADGSKRKHCSIDLGNSAVGEGTLESRFTPAFRTTIGQPIAAYVKSANITPPIGTVMRSLSRSFSLDGGVTASAYAVILVSSGSPGSTNYDDTSGVTLVLPAAPVGKQWYLLRWDGTTEVAPATTVLCRRAEGVIFLAKP
jgi:hypothetical protein